MIQTCTVDYEARKTEFYGINTWKEEVISKYTGSLTVGSPAFILLFDKDFNLCGTFTAESKLFLGKYQVCKVGEILD
jgi:hypothetical protein